MKKIYGILFFLFIILATSYSQINVITYNIRLNTSSDGVHAWPYRKADVVNLLRFHKADIFCLQEALHDQVNYVDSSMAEFSFAGVGRDDGIEAGEYSPVFYRTSRFELLDKGNFWLSKTPDLPGLGWDAACIRICSYVTLKDRNNGKEFMVFNTHFDHVGVKARIHAANLIQEKIDELAGNSPVILCGDLNLPPESKSVRKIASYLDDAMVISELPPFGENGSWSGFTYDDFQGERIDYIFVTPGTRVLRYGILTDSRDRSFFSDHLPVLAEVVLP